jgi:hypothetical protein
LQDTLNQIQQLNSTEVDSVFVDPIDLAPVETADNNYWFKDFVTDVLQSTQAYLESRIYFDGNPLEENYFKSNALLIILILILGISLIAFVRSFHRKRLKLISKALVNWKFGKQIVRYEKVYTHPVNVVLVLNFFLLGGLFFSFLILEITESTFSLLSILSISMLGLITFSVVKLIIYKFTGWVFKSKEIVTEYIFHVNLINKFLGFVFLVLCLVLSFSKLQHEPIYWIGITAIIISIGLQTFRGIFIGLQKSKDLILIILYLCTLEILPLLLMGKLILNEL